MILQPAGLDAIDSDALQTDRYLDALLAAIERGAADVPADTAVDPALRRAARRLRDELVRTHPSFRFEERLARRLADAAVRMRLATAAGGEAEAALIPFPGPLLADPMLAAELANPELAALLGARDGSAVRGDVAKVESTEAPAGGARAAATPAGGSLAAPAPAGGSRAAATPIGHPNAAAPEDGLSSSLRPGVARPLIGRGALTSAALSLAGAAFVAWRLTRGAPADPMARAVRAARAAREAATATTTRLTVGAAAAAGHATTSTAGATPAALRRRRLA